MRIEVTQHAHEWCINVRRGFGLHEFGPIIGVLILNVGSSDHRAHEQVRVWMRALEVRRSFFAAEALRVLGHRRQRRGPVVYAPRVFLAVAHHE